MATCLIEHCPNDRRVLSPVCAACAQSFRYWEKRGPNAINERQARLEKWQDRMKHLGARAKTLRKVANFIQTRRASDGRKRAA